MISGIFNDNDASEEGEIRPNGVFWQDGIRLEMSFPVGAGRNLGQKAAIKFVPTKEKAEMRRVKTHLCHVTTALLHAI